MSKRVIDDAECNEFILDAWRKHYAGVHIPDKWVPSSDEKAIARAAIRQIDRWRLAMEHMNQYNGRTVGECLRLADEDLVR
jgi:hypothetical protein